MRTSALASVLKSKGCTFANRYDIEVPLAITDLKTEYSYIRDAVGLTDFSHMQRFTIPEATAVEFLDSLVAGAVVRTRFGRMLHTFLANEEGAIIADCFIVNNDDEYILLCESIVSDTVLNAILNNHGAQEAGLVDVSANSVLFSLDGFSAWKVVKELFGADVLGLPYLSVENYTFENERIRLLRTGKTSEFGYLLLAPSTIAEKLFTKLSADVTSNNGGVCGLLVHNELRLEGRFFNIYAEGMAVCDPLTLGLQWMIDFEKSAFVGRDAILSKRMNGPVNKIIGIRSATATEELAIGDTLWDDRNNVATVVATCFSHVLNCYVGLAVFPVAQAFSGLQFYRNGLKGALVQTISMPPIMPKSLSLKLDEM